MPDDRSPRSPNGYSLSESLFHYYPTNTPLAGVNRNILEDQQAATEYIDAFARRFNIDDTVVRRSIMPVIRQEYSIETLARRYLASGVAPAEPTTEQNNASTDPPVPDPERDARIAAHERIVCAEQDAVAILDARYPLDYTPSEGDRIAVREGPILNDNVELADIPEFYGTVIYTYNTMGRRCDIMRDDGREGSGNRPRGVTNGRTSWRIYEYSPIEGRDQRIRPIDPSEGIADPRSSCSTCNARTLVTYQCGQCQDCCTHDHCPRCVRIGPLNRVECHGSETTGGEHLCSHCDQCENHCECFYCEACESHQETGCDSCGVCSECCTCERCEECGYIQCCCTASRQAGSPFLPMKSKLSRFDCERLVGVEIEYNEVNSRAPITSWCRSWRAGVHDDGSCGQEIVTAPMAGDWIEECIGSLGEKLKEAGATIDNRCGVHVHVDVKDYSWHDMYRLLWVYAKIEPLLYLFAGQHRIVNTYCTPCGNKFTDALSQIDRKGAILDLVYNRDPGRGKKYVRDYKPGKKDGGRYRGLNICPWLAGRRANGKRKQAKPVKNDTTVEFRLHRNTKDMSRVVGWTKLCARLVDWCANATDREAQELFIDSKGNIRSPLRALSVIAPDCKQWMFERITGWRKACSAKKNSHETTKPLRRIGLRGKSYEIRGSVTMYREDNSDGSETF